MSGEREGTREGTGAERYDLDSAYELESPDAARRRYDAWSATYDADFAAAQGYVAPRRIAEVFAAEAGPADTPVLDLGAGTGLVAEALAPLFPGAEIDAVDISEGMLARAAEKGIYRARVIADLTAALPFADGAYGGFVSCGTFTHGHVGPEAFPELLRVARPGALFVLGTIAPVYDGAGIGSALARLVAARRIEPVRFEEIAIYEGAEHPHAGDRGLVMVFRRPGGGAG